MSDLLREWRHEVCGFSSTQRLALKKKENTRPKSPWTVGRNEDPSWPPLHSTAFLMYSSLLRRSRRNSVFLSSLVDWGHSVSNSCRYNIYTAYKTPQTHLTFVCFVRTLLSDGHPRQQMTRKKYRRTAFQEDREASSFVPSKCTLHYGMWHEWKLLIWRK